MVRQRQVIPATGSGCNGWCCLPREVADRFMTHANIALLFLLLQVSLSRATADTLEEFSAYYSATTNGIRGAAERHLVRLTERNYRLNVSLEAKLGGLAIGDLEQASEFSYADIQINLTYSYQVSGVATLPKQSFSTGMQCWR